jgi:hypothetical protein
MPPLLQPFGQHLGDRPPAVELPGLEGWSTRGVKRERRQIHARVYGLRLPQPLGPNPTWDVLGLHRAHTQGHSVKYLAAYAPFEVLEGENVEAVFLAEWPSMEAAKAWYDILGAGSQEPCNILFP